MSYIHFDKECLVNLKSSLQKELVRSNRAGAFACTTIIGCNTRKYHGLLICPQPTIDNDNHVLLSCIDETIVQQNAEFNLAIHKFPGNVYSPKGHKYCTEFNTDSIPSMTYTVGGVFLTKERIFSHSDERMLIKYTLVDAHSPTILKLRPFLAYRSVHKLAKANDFVDNKFTKIPNGIKLRMYSGYSYLYLQFSKDSEYVHSPDWHYNFEYDEERERGYDFHEDLYTPGYFEVPIKKGESIIISAGLDEINPSTISRVFNSEIKKRTPRNSYENCLVNSAQQFIVKKDKKTNVIAGFPWFGAWGRDTFISLPGLTLTLGDFKTCKAVIDTMISELNGPLFPNVLGDNSSYNSVDAPLWFFWTLQQYAKYTDSIDLIWKEYSKKMKLILNGFADGTDFNIFMNDNGLIHAGEQGKAVTWMDAVVAGKPVTARIGYPVEVNALWYNAVMFSIQVAEAADDMYFVEQWKPIAAKIAKSFVENFWDDSKGYLADYFDSSSKDWSVRPNQIIAAALPFSPLDDEKIKSIINIVSKELLTPRGLRSLSPKHPDYKGFCFGDQHTRDLVYHQGTVWPWLIGFFVDAYYKIHKENGNKFITKIYKDFEDAMYEHGIGSISEIYDGDPPHSPRGAISQAWSVSELLRIAKLIGKI